MPPAPSGINTLPETLMVDFFLVGGEGGEKGRCRRPGKKKKRHMLQNFEHFFVKSRIRIGRKMGTCDMWRFERNHET